MKETDPKKPVVKKPVKSRNTAPAFTSITHASYDEVLEAVGEATHRNAFTKALDVLDLGKGLKVEGDFNRLRAAAAVFGKKSGKQFLVRKSKENGFVIVVYLKPLKVPGEVNSVLATEAES
jgi:hypothetical protein